MTKRDITHLSAAIRAFFFCRSCATALSDAYSPAEWSAIDLLVWPYGAGCRHVAAVGLGARIIGFRLRSTCSAVKATPRSYSGIAPAIRERDLSIAGMYMQRQATIRETSINRRHVIQTLSIAGMYIRSRQHLTPVLEGFSRTPCFTMAASAAAKALRSAFTVLQQLDGAPGCPKSGPKSVVAPKVDSRPESGKSHTARLPLSVVRPDGRCQGRLVPATRERSINRRHVYTKQAERSINRRHV